MQELLASQAIGRDQPQEEVQLTELLPVKQSRIRANDIFKDTNTTDALKALRSFAGGCREEQDFGLRVFEFNQTINQHSELRLNDKLDNDIRSREDIEIDVKVSKTSKQAAIREKERFLKMKSNKNGKKGRILLKPPRKVVTMNSETENIEKLRNHDTRKLKVKKKYEEYKSQEVVHLELEKTKSSLRDEIYVFRCDSLEPSFPADAEGTADNMKTDDDGKDGEDGNSMNSILFNIPAVLSKKNDGNHDENTNVSLKSPTIPATADDSEKELQLKIDAIIQANLLAKRDNNNVLRTNRNKAESGAPITACVIAEKTEGITEIPRDENINVQVVKSLKNKDKNGNLGKSESKKQEDSREEGQEELPKKYCCVVCDARFKGSGGLRNHYKVIHGAGPLFKCDECGKEFPLKERLKLHVRTHTGFKPYKCNECDKSFARGGQLVQHRRTHSQVKPYRCALCSGTFTCAANLALHLKRHNGQKDHKCEICGRGFVRRDALKKHLECLHRDVKSFLCNICNKTFKGHLPQHMRTHIRDRPHGCATCGQRFAQKSQLTVHQRTHSGQRPFRCLVCWQAFAHSTALKLHTRRHTGERPFKCAECNAGFTQLPHWKKHMKCIHGRNEPYSCRKCNSFFRIKNDLESHEKTCHPEMDDQPQATDNVATNIESQEKAVSSKYRVMNIERMRLLLAVLLKRISRQERLDELGFGKRLIDEVLHDSLCSAGKTPVSGHGLSEFETLSKNLETFLQWTVPKEHWEQFRKMKKTPEDILETLTAT